jgi:hypothetical protein
MMSLYTYATVKYYLSEQTPKIYSQVDDFIHSCIHNLRARSTFLWKWMSVCICVSVWACMCTHMQERESVCVCVCVCVCVWGGGGGKALLGNRPVNTPRLNTCKATMKEVSQGGMLLCFARQQHTNEDAG